MGSSVTLLRGILCTSDLCCGSSQAYLAVNSLTFLTVTVYLCKHNAHEIWSVLGSWWGPRNGVAGFACVISRALLSSTYSVQGWITGASPSLFQLSGTVIQTCNCALASRFILRCF